MTSLLLPRPQRLALLALLFFSSWVVHADGEAGFPADLAVTENGTTHQLSLTGEAERKFFLFRVYEIAHYAEDGEAQSLSTDTVVSDGPAKAILITFARKLGRDQIRDEFDKSLRRNAQDDWLAAAEPTIAAFIDAIDRDAQAGDQLVFYWLSGGQLFAEFNGERAFAVTDTAFAKLVWSIWFGAKPACDREELLARATKTGDA